MIDFDIYITADIKVGAVGRTAAVLLHFVRRIVRLDPPCSANCGSLCGGWPVARHRVGSGAAGTGEEIAAASKITKNS